MRRSCKKCVLHAKAENSVCALPQKTIFLSQKGFLKGHNSLSYPLQIKEALVKADSNKVWFQENPENSLSVRCVAAWLDRLT